MVEPSQLDVDSFLSFCEIVTGNKPDVKLAPRYIKDANGDLDRAISNYEQDPNRYAADKYDEALFSQDRDGGSNQYAGVPSFQIDHANDSLSQYPQSTAATRPNTPSNSMHDSGRGSQAPDASTGQETGVVGASGVQFGPATREYYEQSQWALTTVSSTIPDPAPAQRKRELGEPSFMKPLPSQDYLPSLLTILNTIPEAHNALLMKNHLLPDYGQDPQWWSGTPIALPQLIDLNDQQQAQNDRRLDIIHETQRIMAFLDSTDRAYGSAEPLAKIDGPQGSEGDKEAVRFLEAWHDAAIHLEPDAGHERLFQTTAQEVRPGEVSNPSFKCLTPVLTNRGDDSPASLYDVLDNTIWANDADGSKEIHASIGSVAEVLVMIVKQPDSTATGLNVDIPVTWFVDRYMAQHEVKAKQMRKDCAEKRRQVAEIQEKTHKLSQFHYNGTSGDAMDLLEVVMSAMSMEPLDSHESRPNSERDAKLYQKLQEVYSRVKRNLEVLKTEEYNARKACDELSGLLKDPSGKANDSPQIKYQLCGISTDPGVTYIKNGRNTMAGGMVDGDGAETEQSRTDWWRTQYSSTGQISKSRISEVDVLTAAAMESREVLLVYASEKALNQPFDEIPQALAGFVSRDNMAFGDELSQDAEQPPPYEANGSVAGTDDSGFANASAQDWYGGQQPEMAEKGAGLVAEMASGGSRGADTDMANAGGAQHIEFADVK